MREMKRHRARTVACVIAAAMLLLAPASFAGDGGGQWVTGKSRLAAKDEAQKTLVLEDVTLQIVTSTRIYNGDARRISFRQIQTPVPRAPVLVRYEGKRSGHIVEASKVVVAMEPH